MTDGSEVSRESGTILEVRDFEPETAPGAPPWRVKTSTGFETWITGLSRPSEGETFEMTLGGESATTVSEIAIAGREYFAVTV